MSIYQRILVPTDGSATAGRGVDEAIAVAQLSGARIQLLHVIDDAGFVSACETGGALAKEMLPKQRRSGERILAAARERVGAAGLEADTLLLECFARGTADVVIEQAKAWNADLIVVGTHGRRGVGRLMMGSVAEEIVRAAAVPVLLIRRVGSESDSDESVQPVEAIVPVPDARGNATA